MPDLVPPMLATPGEDWAVEFAWEGLRFLATPDRTGSACSP